ncbi:putative N-acetyltransferase (TIGR04045 family) [Rhodococcus sp. 27YEA15]|uniref:MSMEG_0567/sll0787 family protein n=1 Tax=Rhodococcus sp. 27YEA15 TaxID=3156259 RepID=UPI003C7CA311
MWDSRSITASATDFSVLTGPTVAKAVPDFLVVRAESRLHVEAYRKIREQTFVAEQALFRESDHDDVDDDPRTVILVAVDPGGDVLGGVRLSPSTDGSDLGWWHGGRLAVSGHQRNGRGIGTALVRAACACAESAGALRFDATVQSRNETMFTRLGWLRISDVVVADAPHVRMTWPISRVERLVRATKSSLAEALAPFRAQDGALGGAGFRGDDGAPVPGSDLIAACDAILPAMVQRDPEWAGWCAALVNLNDLSAMGAAAIGLLDAVGAPNTSILNKVIRGLAHAAAAWEVPVLGGHTQLGVPAALSVTALGRTPHPVPAGGGRLGDGLTLTVDTGGRWRPGYTGQQWDSTSTRNRTELQEMTTFVARTRPAAAKDISMAGIAGTVGMLAEASGLGAELDVAAIPRPAGTSVGDWLTCFPGFAMVTADRPGSAVAPAGPATTSLCGQLTHTAGVSLRWPDGATTRVIDSTVTGLGRA